MRIQIRDECEFSAAAERLSLSPISLKDGIVGVALLTTYIERLAVG
jgi:hypothetical protein